VVRDQVDESDGQFIGDDLLKSREVGLALDRIEDATRVFSSSSTCVFLYDWVLVQMIGLMLVDR
jgi:hypothetical protein